VVRAVVAVSPRLIVLAIVDLRVEADVSAVALVDGLVDSTVVTRFVEGASRNVTNIGSTRRDRYENWKKTDGRSKY